MIQVTTKQFEYVCAFRKTDKSLVAERVLEVVTFQTADKSVNTTETIGHAYFRTRNINLLEGCYNLKTPTVFKLSELSVREHTTLVANANPSRAELIACAKAAYVGCSDNEAPQSKSRGISDDQMEALCDRFGIECVLELGEAILTRSHPDPDSIAPFASRLG